MSNFITYWNSYANVQEAKEETKSAWSTESIARGIVQAALQEVAGYIGSRSSDHFTTTALGDGVWVINEAIEYKGVRVSVLGCSESTAEANDILRREVENRGRENWCLSILPSSELTVWPLSTSNQQIGAANIIALYPSDIDIIASGKINLECLFEYKLYRRLVLDKPDYETQYHKRLFDEFKHLSDSVENRFEPLEEYISSLQEDYREWVDHPLVSRVTYTLEHGRGCLLIGSSSSGKSVLAMQVGRGLLLSGRNVYYLSLGSISGFLPGLLSLFLFNDAPLKSSVFIADDLQSNPSLSRYTLAISSAASRVRVSAYPTVVGISWEDFSRDAIEWYENCLPVPVRPHQIRSKIVQQYGNKLSSDIRNELLSLVGEDLFLLRIALIESNRRGYRVSLNEIGEEVWQSRTDGSNVQEEVAIRATLVAGSLGRYDIATPIDFLKVEAQIDDNAIDGLIRTRLLRRQRENLSIGHRSLCGLLTDWLGRKEGWKELANIQGPKKMSDVVLDYLKSLGSSFAVDSLRALHARAGFKEKPQLNRRAASLVEVWRAFNAVVERIEHQQSIDPTWGRVPSSATFAIQTFTQIGKHKQVRKSLEFLRRHWEVAEEKLNVIIEGLATVDDFIQISNEIKSEDVSYLDRKLPAFWETARDIDINRFHRTWLMGLILGSEAAAAKPAMSLDRLASLVENEQLECGAFYPKRVPWCTARVLLGLALCGRTIDTSEAVIRAIDWLLRDEESGGACIGGIWQSGTGKWNSIIETTGMVLLAIAAVGYDCTDIRLEPARSFLLSQKSFWTATGSELDGAVALQAYLDIGGEWEEVVHEAQRLSHWARGEAVWQGATLSSQESLKQSCYVAQIASHLISIGWTAIRSDLPEFLDALAIPHLFRAEMFDLMRSPLEVTETIEEMPSEAVLPEYDDPILQTLLNIDRISLSEFTVVGQYRRHDERVRHQLRDWVIRIGQPLSNPTSVHENFLIWADPGSGKSFFVQEVATSLGDSVQFIELNLARQSRDSFIQGLTAVKEETMPVLCLIDEIDSRGEDAWPYEECFSLLDINLLPNRSCVIVLIGSLSTGLQGLVRNIEERTKGKDLLDRIPINQRFEIPPLSLGDRVIVVASQINCAAEERNQQVKYIEKLALYYAIKNEALQTPRQLRDLAYSAMYRLPTDQDGLKYDDLFFRGDNRNQRFWVEHQEAAGLLSNVYVRLEI